MVYASLVAIVVCHNIRRIVHWLLMYMIGHCDMDSPTPTSVQPIPTTAPVTPSNNSTPFTSPYNATNTPAVKQVTGAPANNNSKLVGMSNRFDMYNFVLTLEMNV